MSRLKLYSVHDSKVGSFGNPFVQRSKGEALRSWQTIANDEQSEICRFPADFSLLELGEFDNETGELIPHKVSISLGTALEVKRETSSSPEGHPIGRAAQIREAFAKAGGPSS